MNRRICLWLNKKDRERLELIRLAYGGSLSGAMRMIIRAASQRLGIEKDNTVEDLLKR